MNHKNNLSLLLASTMVSGMFSAAVNATAYKFTKETGNLAVHAVSSKNVVALEDSENITLDLSAGEKPSQKFAFSVSPSFLNDNAAKAINNKVVVDAETINRLNGRAVEATEALTEAAKTAYPVVALAAGGASAETAGQIATAKKYANACRQAVEVMAEIRGEMKDKANAKELLGAVRSLAVAYSAAMQKVVAGTNGNEAVVSLVKIGDNFKTSDLVAAGAANNEDADTPDHIVQRALTTGAGNANAPTRMGLCVGERIVGINDALKYKIVGTRHQAINALANLNAELVATAAEVDATAINNVVSPGADVTTHTGAGARAGAGTMIEDRGAPAAFAGNVTQNVVVMDRGNGHHGIVHQLARFASWAEGWFYVRAYDFLTAVEEKEVANAVNASWLGAGAYNKSLNAVGDYEVTVEFKNDKGKDAVAVRKYTESKVTLGGEGGAAVTPIVVEFVPKTVTKDTTVEGTLKITSAGATQKIKVEGVVHRTSGDAYLAEQDDDSEAEVIWDTSIDNEDENMPQSFMRAGQQNDAKKAGKEDEKEIPIKIQIKCCPDQCNIF